MAKKVLVTGAGGFLGSAVMKRLAEMDDYETTAVISGRRPVNFPEGIRIETADLLAERARTELMERTRPDVMLHFAWSLDDGGFLNSEDNIKWLEASLHICRLFRSCGGTRFLFAGSSSEYGTGFAGSTEMPRQPMFSLYGNCKLAFEQIAENFFKQNAMEFASARFFSIYGPGDDRPGRALPLAISKILSGEKFYCMGPGNIWDYIYVDDAAEAAIRLLESTYCGPINIASGKTRTMREVFAAVAELIGAPDLIEFDETKFGSVIYSANVELMQTVLHYQCSTPFREGLKKTIQWWRDKLEAEKKE